MTDWKYGNRGPITPLEEAAWDYIRAYIRDDVYSLNGTLVRFLDTAREYFPSQFMPDFDNAVWSINERERLLQERANQTSMQLCEHEWVDPRSDVWKSGCYCKLCGLLCSTNADEIDGRAVWTHDDSVYCKHCHKNHSVSCGEVECSHGAWIPDA